MHTASENKGVGSSVVEHVLSKNIKVVMLAQPEDLDPRARFTLFYLLFGRSAKFSAFSRQQGDITAYLFLRLYPGGRRMREVKRQ